MSTPEARLANQAWRRQHSKWLLGPILGVGMLTVFSLLYAGRKLRDTQVTRIAIALVVPTAFAWVVVLTSNTEPGSESRPIDSVAAAIFIGIWIGGGVYCVRLNRRLLRLHASAVAAPWHGQPQTSIPPLPPLAQGSQAGGWTGTLGLDAVQQHAFAPPQPPANSGPRPSQPPVSAAKKETPHARSIDVNTADEVTLRSLPGVGPALAKRVLAQRDARGGFASPEDLAAAGVPPHVLAGILSNVTFSPRPTPPPRGRVLDL